MAASNNMQHHVSEHHESNNQPDDHNSPANLEVEQVERDDNIISDRENSYSEDTEVLLEQVNNEISDPHEVFNMSPMEEEEEEDNDDDDDESADISRTASVTLLEVTISVSPREEADDEQQADHNVMQVPENNHPSVVHYSEEEVATNREILESMLDILNSLEDTLLEGDLELEEETEQVGSRLSEETIMRHIQTENYTPTTTSSLNEESDICVICQGEFEYGESIGGLHCGHKYHEQCIKTWLQQMNNCPICKATAVL